MCDLLLDSGNVLRKLQAFVTSINWLWSWKAPRTSSEVRSFLGLAGYYRRFIEDFSKIAKSLTVLTRKSKTYDCGEEQENAFQTLKDKLCNAPVLSLTDGPEDFMVYCDASGLGLGCVLMQREEMLWGCGVVTGVILEQEFKKLKRSIIAIVKVRWNSKRRPEFTREHDDHMKLKYLHLFSADSS
ncbi:putative reverse transcriptase domain-containing protein [Tanacetum coccineum]